MRDPREYIDSDIRCLLEDADELADYVLPEFEDLSVTEQDIWLYEWPNKRAGVLEKGPRPFFVGAHPRGPRCCA